MTSALNLPLDGIRIIDMTTVMFGPFATQLAGDLGADVIKVEPPAGDPTRGIGPARNNGMAAGFLGCNRNKRSVVLDLKKPQARDALERLLGSADAFVHNVRPQKMRTMDLHADAVMKRHPELVYGALHGYLESGPYAGRPAYDDVIQSECGIAGAFAARDGVPAFAPTVMADKSAGLLAACGLIAALFQRLRSGKGVYMEIGMFESMAAYTLLEHQFGTVFEPAIGGAGYSRALSQDRRPHRTRDGYIAMLAYTDAQWRSFWQIAGREEVADDPRYRTLADRTQHIDSLYQEAATCLTERDSREWLDLLSAAEIPCGPVNTFEDVISDKHLEQTGFFRSVDHPSEGQLTITDPGLRFDGRALPIRKVQPALGEQGAEILAEAGLSVAEIEALADS